MFVFFSQITNEIYEIPDGKPAAVPVPTIVPEWLKKVTVRTEPSDENAKPPPEVYIEHVLLPTRATKVVLLFYILIFSV